MTGHIYSIGQQVSLDGPGRTYMKLVGVFTVTRLLPPLGVELQYRIKSETEAHERVAAEQELRVVEVAKSIVAPASRLSSHAFPRAVVNNNDRLCDQLGTSGPSLNARPDDAED
jgi:hypothetical protein